MYREFISDALKIGRREELVGGGLRRSQKGKAEVNQSGSSDSRVLGSGEFVDRLQERKELRERLVIPLPLRELVDRVSVALKVDSGAMRQPSKVRALAEARGLVCYLAIREFGYKGLEVGRELHLAPAGVSLAVRRGAAFLNENPEFKKNITQIEK